MDCLLWTPTVEEKTGAPDVSENSGDTNTLEDGQDNVRSDNNENTMAISKDAKPPPVMFITCVQNLPPPLQWLEAEEDGSDDENDAICSDFDFHDACACAGMPWRRTGSEGTENEIAKDSTQEEKEPTKMSWFETALDDVLHVCGFRDAAPSKPCSSSRRNSAYAWI